MEDTPKIIIVLVTVDIEKLVECYLWRSSIQTSCSNQVYCLTSNRSAVALSSEP